MKLTTPLTIAPKVELRRTHLWKTLSRIGEILLLAAVRVWVGFVVSHSLLRLIHTAEG